MTFISYVIAWTIISVILLAITSLFYKFLAFIRDKTPLGKRYHNKRFKDIDDLAVQVSVRIMNELSANNYSIKKDENDVEVVNND